MKLKSGLFAAMLSLTLGSFAQSRTCGKTPDESWNNWFNAKVAEFSQQAQAGKAAVTGYTIPVVVHVIHGGQNIGQFPNLSQAQVNSQIAVLNADYAGVGLNVGNVPAAFAPLVANTGITFAFAMLDPNGNALTEAGIDRVDYHSISGAVNPSSNTSAAALMSSFDNVIKPATIWDPSRYFNIWVSDANGSTGILGYATFPAGGGLSGNPSGGTASDDGIWIGARYFGNTGSVTYPYNKGRTATHEAGHWLGLRHIDGDSNCGNDYCADTPVQQTLNYGCQTFPKVSCSNSPNGEMFMNFMDYSDDACLYMFTNDQKTRMLTALNNAPFRKFLTASSATVTNLQPVAAIAEFNLADQICIDSLAIAANVSSGTPGPVYAWSATPSVGVTFSPSATAPNPTIVASIPGYYDITLVATNSAGSNSQVSNLYVQDCGNIDGIAVSRRLDHVTVYPNPSSGRIFVSGLTGSETVEVSSLLGETVSRLNGTKDNASIDLGRLPDGLYFVKISSGANSVMKRVLVAR